MDYRENAILYIKQLIEDGAGGYIAQDVEIKSIKCKVAPFSIKDMNSAGGLVVYSKNKLFTQEKLDKLLDLDEDFYIFYKDKHYKKESVADYGKCYMVVMERDNIGNQDII